VIVENSSSNEEVLDDPCVYLIQSGNTPQEFYTYSIPTLDKDKIVVSNPFQKGIITETILDKTIEEYFFEPIISTDAITDLMFDLKSGILIQKCKVSDLDWIMRSDWDAKNTIKDKIISKYQKLIPNLINKINNIENKVKNNSGSVKNNEDLLDF